MKWIFHQQKNNIFLTKQKDRNGPGPEMGMLRKLIERVRVLT